MVVRVFILPQQLRGCLVFCWQQSPGADDVLQELNGQVLQVMIPLKVLAVFGDPVPHHGENSHGGR